MKRILSLILLAALTASLSSCGSTPAESQAESSSESSVQTESGSSAASDPETGWVNPEFNDHTLTRLRLIGRGDASENYKVAFFEPKTLSDVEAFMICYSVSDFEEVWEYLSSLSADEIYDLDKPVNRAYVMTDLSYCDGVGNTLNTAQKDLITGEDFSEPGIHYFYAAAIGKDGLLSLEKAEQTAFISPIAEAPVFTRKENILSGSFASYPESEIQKNYVFLSAAGYNGVKEQMKTKNRAALDALAESGCVLSFANSEKTEFTLNLSECKDLEGKPVDPDRCYYVYTASASDKKMLGLSYSADQMVTPAPLPISNEAIGDGKGMIFPNGGAAQIGGGRGSIISTAQAVMKELPDKPRLAMIGTASGSERELWSHFYEDSSAKSYSSRFADAGFEPVYIPLTAENKDTIGEDEYFASLISSCHGVYFTGGDQSLGMYALTRKDGSLNAAGQAIADLFARGGFAAGTSAGAHMLGNLCFQDADSYDSLTHPVPQKTILSSEGVNCGPEGVLYDGLPFALDASGHSLVFDSHFGARGRLGRLAMMQGASGADFAVGLDENTGLAITNGTGVVYGAGTVTILDKSQAVYDSTDSRFAVSGLKITLLSAGDKIDFTSGKMIPASSKTAASGDRQAEHPEDLLGASSVQARAMLSLALSGEESAEYTVSADQGEFTFAFRKAENFSAFTGEKPFDTSALSDLPKTCAEGILLDIH